MMSHPLSLIGRHPAEALWCAWLIIWVTTARFVKPTAKTEEPRSQWVTSAILFAGGILILWDRFVPGVPDPAIFAGAVWLKDLGLVITAVGLAFATWARLSLGANWSGRATIKEGHDLVVSGAYALVRHPIYSGILGALIGTVITLDHWRGIIGIILVTVGLWHKIRVEEQMLIGQFGDSYRAYKRRVPALIPFLPV